MYEGRTILEDLEDWAAMAEVGDVASSEVPAGPHGEDIPAIMIKGPRGSTLEKARVAFDVTAFETPECPVVAVSIYFRHQGDLLRNEYRCYAPIHTVAMRDLLNTMANSPVWCILLFSGDMMTESKFAPVGDENQARCRHIRDHIRKLPLNDDADVHLAKALTHLALAKKRRPIGMLMYV